jgi:hypothetical protein
MVPLASLVYCIVLHSKYCSWCKLDKRTNRLAKYLKHTHTHDVDFDLDINDLLVPETILIYPLCPPLTYRSILHRSLRSGRQTRKVVWGNPICASLQIMIW